MVATHLVDFNQFTPPQLCEYMEQQQYAPLRHTFEALHHTMDAAIKHARNGPRFEVTSMLVERLQSEAEQLMRNDEMILFPLIKRAAINGMAEAPKVPSSMIRSKNEKIMSILQRLRQLSSNYMLQPDWDQESRLFYEQLFQTDQAITQCIYLKENVLLPMMDRIHART